MPCQNTRGLLTLGTIYSCSPRGTDSKIKPEEGVVGTCRTVARAFSDFVKWETVCNTGSTVSW